MPVRALLVEPIPEKEKAGTAPDPPGSFSPGFLIR